MEPVMLPGHHHPLHLSRRPVHCSGCSEEILDSDPCYHCDSCGQCFHGVCAHASPEINHPCHPAHPLTLLTRGPPDASDGKCRLCGKVFGQLVYHCSICKFSIDMACARQPPPLEIDYPKCHGHSLILMPRRISFACNACGLDDNRSPYVCSRCNFMVHIDCVYLPRVIKIIRHKHRLSRTYLLGLGDWVCGVCRQEIDGCYGAYTCSVCSYAVQAKCATRSDVWDGRELEDEPEEPDDTEDVTPFVVVDDKVIKHFSHEHDLRIHEDGGSCDKKKRCQACILPVYSDPFYSCMQCDFILHETCANLPRKKRHVLHQHPLTLQADGVPSDDLYQGIFECSACERLCCGFRYRCCGIQLDIRCGSISEPFIHHCHHHPMFRNSQKRGICGACGLRFKFALNCIDCVDPAFAMDFHCATLPITIRHWFDEHPLTLRCGESASGPYWCEICEKEVDPKRWFYTCDDCGFTPHVECALGKFPYVKVGTRLAYESSFENFQFDVVPNDRLARPFCKSCGLRSTDSVILKSTKDADVYACSRFCLTELPYL